MVSKLNVEKVVKEPTNPVPIAVVISGGKEVLLNNLVVNQANKKLPIRLILNVAKGNELFVNNVILIKYLNIAPKAPAIPTKKQIIFTSYLCTMKNSY